MRQTEPFNRMPRIREALPEGEVKIPGPPNVSTPSSFNWFQVLLPLAGVFVMVAIYGGVRGDWLLALPMVAMSGFSVLGSVVGRVMQRKNREKEAEEKEAAYAEALAHKRARLAQLRQKQQRIRSNADPDLDTLLERARNRDSKLWERRPEDDDFLGLRLGTGALPASVAVSAPHPDMPDPRLDEAHAIEAEYSTVPEVPVTVSIRTGPLSIAGPLRDRIGAARALICNLCVHHSPDEVHLLAIYSTTRTSEWHWLKWLPHAHAISEEGGKRYLANDSLSAEEVLRGLLEELHRRQNQLYAVERGRTKPDWPWLVVLVEDYALVRDHPAMHLLLNSGSQELNATAIFTVDRPHRVPMGCTAFVECRSDGQLRVCNAGIAKPAPLCWPEQADAALSEELARSLAPVQVHTLQSDNAMPTSVRLLDLVNVKDIDGYDVTHRWTDRSSEHYLKVPIGERRGDQPMELNLDHTGHGPHGLIAGTTGSGKSELLQTLVVSLALTHHPHDVGFVLVDFKGGGTFSELVDLPHTLGMVTDLSGDLTERALVALEAEMVRRKQLFNDAGVNDIGDYQRLYWRQRAEDPLPRVVVIIDEFAELVEDYPAFMDGLIGIARVGRSLGIHLILATQSPAGVVKQQIWANAKFRICLRVEDRQESMSMLRRPEAANLPRMPGRGYLQVGNNEVFELFQVARVAGRYHVAGDTGPLQSDEHIVIAQVSPLGRRNVLFDSHKEEKKASSGPTDIDVVVPRLIDVAEEMGLESLPSPWPDPLPDHIALPDLLLEEGFSGWDGNEWVFDKAALGTQPSGPRFCRECGDSLRAGAEFCKTCGTPVKTRCDQCGSLVRRKARFCPSCGAGVLKPPSRVEKPPAWPHPPASAHRPWLGALMGLLDDPANQRQIPMLLDLADQDGQLIAIGAPGSGKDMWTRTLVMSLARTHTPDELHFYLFEFGGQALKVFADLPHVGGIFTPLDDERVKRLLRLLLDSLDIRKHLCNEAGVDGLIRLRELQPEETPPAVVIVVTGFMEFRSLFQDEMLQLTRLIREGGPYGIHVVLVGDRAGDVPTAIRSVVARRIALRLADVDEYSLVMGTRLRPSKEQSIPSGRGWYGRPPLEFQTAYPGYHADENKQISGLKQTVEHMDEAWQGPRPEPVEVLSDEIPLSEVLDRLPAPPTSSPHPQIAVPIGLDAVRMRPTTVDLVDDGPNFLVASTPQGGKTTLLLAWSLALAEFNSPQQVQLVVMSGRRDSLRALRNLPHILDYSCTPEGFCVDGVLDRLLGEIDRREDVLSKSLSLAGRIPHIVAIFDDYNDFAGAVGAKQDVQDGLSALIKRGRDVNVHTVVTGPLPNMGVGYADPIVSQLKAECSGFLLRILDATAQNPLSVRLRSSEIKKMPPGRGYIVRKGSEEMIQVATPGDRESVIDRVRELTRRWREEGTDKAIWRDKEYSTETD